MAVSDDSPIELLQKNYLRGRRRKIEYFEGALNYEYNKMRSSVMWRYII